MAKVFDGVIVICTHSPPFVFYPFLAHIILFSVQIGKFIVKGLSFLSQNLPCVAFVYCLCNAKACEITAYWHAVVLLLKRALGGAGISCGMCGMNQYIEDREEHL